MTNTRESRNVEITDNDLLSAGYYIAGLRGMGSSFIKVISKASAASQTVIQVWRQGRGFCRFKVSEQDWPSSPKNVDFGVLKDYEDLQALTELYSESSRNLEKST